jgi:tRNA uridine 5-carbamoylmethylation protein Kti12
MKHVKTYEIFLNEGKVVNVDNPNEGNFIIFMGAPGSGKSFSSKHFININNARYFNVDDEREKTAKKLGLDLSKPEDNEEILKHTYNSTDPRNRTIKLLKTMLKSEHKILPNIIFDTTGNHINLMKELINLAKEKGYTTTMVYVKCSLETSLERNSKRKRRLGDDVVIKYHNLVNQAFDKLFPLYDHAWVIDAENTFDIVKRKDIIHQIK